MKKSVRQSKSTRDWHQATIDALIISGKRRRTAEAYAREVRVFGEWLNHSLSRATEDDLKRFILYRRNECKLSGSSMRILAVGMRFFFEHMLRKKWPVLEIMSARPDRTLPTVLTREEVWKIIQATKEFHNRVYFQTVYSCGLRLSEAARLTIHDIDGERMRIHVRLGKGGKDRYVPLPRSVYLLLRKYWVTHRNPKFIFPALGRNQKGGATATAPMETSSVQCALKRSLRAAGITRPGVRIHTFRHSYATHLLESGVNVHAIQRYLGHERLETTLRYFHLTTTAHAENLQIIDELMKGA